MEAMEAEVTEVTEVDASQISELTGLGVQLEQLQAPDQAQYVESQEVNGDGTQLTEVIIFTLFTTSIHPM